jgi:hypothetical protein
VRKRVITNLKEVLYKIREHGIWELAPFFPEINFPPRRKSFAKNYFIFCPFHKEREASLCFEIDSRLIHCFGCDFSGDIINFYMTLKYKSFFAAVIRLAKFFGIGLVWGKENVVGKKKEIILPDIPWFDNNLDGEDEQEIPF